MSSMSKCLDVTLKGDMSSVNETRVIITKRVVIFSNLQKRELYYI